MDMLQHGQRLALGERISSADGNYFLLMQGDGNLVLYDNNNLDYWATNTVGSNACFATMQSDGNFVLFTQDMKPVWSSNTDKHPNCHLILQNDRNLVIYENGDNPIWNSNTNIPDSTTFNLRPFYIVAHNPNSIEEVITALNLGANALEPDVNVFEDNQSELCLSEDISVTFPFIGAGGSKTSPCLTQYLDDLHSLALQNPHLSLVVFDCKPKAATSEFGLTLLTEIRNRLTFDIDLNIIISVADLSNVSIFDNIKEILRPREGLMIDSENNPLDVSNYFQSIGVVNQTYGNGHALSSIIGPDVRPSMERVCAFRAATNLMKFIYTWTINDEDLMRQYINIGVDGIDSDDISKLINVVNEFNQTIRIANRTDNPIRPTNFAYSLSIHTDDVLDAGTDANIAFTITSASGSSSITINSEPPHRMERNEWNYVTIYSKDLGSLSSISVQRDNQGNAPDWNLDKIIVESHTYNVSKTATFNRWIDSTSSFIENLV